MDANLNLNLEVKLKLNGQPETNYHYCPLSCLK